MRVYITAKQIDSIINAKHDNARLQLIKQIVKHSRQTDNNSD